MSSSRLVASALVGLLAASTGGPFARVSVTRASSAQPEVALILTIERSDYEAKLSSVPCVAPCQRLPRALVDSVRTLLESSYAYLNWTTSSSTRDTLHIAWIRDVDTTYYSSRVDFRVRSADPVIRVDSFPVAFEDWPVVIQRNGAVDGWHPDSVRRVWLALLDSVILTPNVRTGVFTRIPLSAVVVFDGTRTAKVNVSPSELGIDTLEGPTFRVRAVVNDPRRGTIESADLRLEDCQRAGDRRAYTCTVNELQYPLPSRPVTESNLDSLLRAATITKARPYIDHYKPERNRRPKSGPLGP